MSSKVKTLNICVIGTGSIGERHVKNLLSLGQKVYVFDKEESKLEYFNRTYGTPVVDIQSPHVKIDAYVICTPPFHHEMFIEHALENKAHVFIEKPVSHNLETIKGLESKAALYGMIVQVGYQLRYSDLWRVRQAINQGLIGRVCSIRAEYGNWLPYWHPKEHYLEMYTCFKKWGGGIILDASHEIDYVNWLAGTSSYKSMHSIYGKVGGLDYDVEDMAEINYVYDNNIVASIHMDCVNREYVRKCSIIGTKGTILWDANKIVKVFLADKEEPEYKRGMLVNKTETTLLSYSPDSLPSDPYLAEMIDFISKIYGDKGTDRGCTLSEGIRVLEMCLLAKERGIELKVPPPEIDVTYLGIQKED